MPIVEVTDYRPDLMFRNAHLNTLYPYFFRKQKTPTFDRKRIETPDGDFFDVDRLLSDNKKAIFLFHGLEGSAESQYIKAMSNYFHPKGFDIFACNFRGCSGETNRKVKSYHSGATDDPRQLIDLYADDYESVYLIGFSLGANVILNYIGKEPNRVHSKIHKAFAVSAPCHLSDGSKVLQQWQNYFYTDNFLGTLNNKIKEKEKQIPGSLDLSLISKIKSVWDFDEYFTGPINGFAGAEDYYAQCMSLQFLPDIQIETHIINALDDTFLSKTSHPFEIAKNHKYVHFHPSKYGGHVGFVDHSKQDGYWIERRIGHFIEPN